MDLRCAIERQRAFFHTGATRLLAYRDAQLRSLTAAIATQEGKLFDALQADLGKSPHQAYTTEIGLVLSEARYARRQLPGWMKPRRGSTPLLSWPSHGWVQPEARGVALIVGPWNYPCQLLLAPLIGAIAAGNCAVLKPSEDAPRTAAAIAQLIGTTFPSEYITVVPGDRATAEALLRERFEAIFFTGSPAVGRAVMAAAAKHLTPVTLELGGKCPCLVSADAPLDIAARRIVWGKFMNAGQTCVAPDFILAERGVRDPLIAAMKHALADFYGEDPRRSHDYGRIVNRRHFDRLTSYLSCGQIAHGGQRDADSLYLAPTIVTDAPWDSPLMQEEIFGPILPVLEFDDLSSALARLRERPAPLALYLFTRDRATQARVLAETRSGGVCLNDAVSHMIGSGLPFGGLGESGLGLYHGRASFDCFTHYRSVLRRSWACDPSLRYPPARTPLPTLKRVFRFLLGA
ncbi:MAG: aldehyde dehydrogenase family protein [Verrucomicrobiota bacterium]